MHAVSKQTLYQGIIPENQIVGTFGVASLGQAENFCVLGRQNTGSSDNAAFGAS